MNKVLNEVIESPAINSNASASAFGWEFQHNAAIFLAFEYIETFTKIKVEGRVDDVELYFEDEEPIYVQVKSQKNPEPSNNTLSYLRDGMKTLINATNQTEYSRLIYCSNINNPLKSKEVGYYFSGLSRLKYIELPENAKKIIDKYILMACEQYHLSKTNFDENMLSIYTIPYFGEDNPTRFREIINVINNFLEKVEIHHGIAEDILYYLQSEFFGNATKKHVKLMKEDILWPIMVMGSLKLPDEELEDFDEGESEEIALRYRNFINKTSQKFGFVTKIVNDFVCFSQGISLKGTSKKKLIPIFINEEWNKYKDDIKLEDEDMQELLIKIILKKVLASRFKINRIKEATNL